MYTMRSLSLRLKGLSSFAQAETLLLYRDNHSVAASLDQKGRLVAGGWQGLAAISDTVHIHGFG